MRPVAWTLLLLSSPITGWSFQVPKRGVARKQTQLQQITDRAPSRMFYFRSRRNMAIAPEHVAFTSRDYQVSNRDLRRVTPFCVSLGNGGIIINK